MHLFEATFERIHWMGAVGVGRAEGNLPLQLTPTVENQLEAILSEAQAAGYVLPHGGQAFTEPVTRLDAASLARIESCLSILPGPNSAIYTLAKTGLALRPDLPHYVFCETAFFLGMPAQSRAYPLPYEFFEGGYQRFGGDGLAHAWAWEQVKSRLPGLKRLVSVRLGDHPSLAAILDGKAVETSQGFTPVEGLPGKTSCGDVDPSIVLLLSENGLSPDQIEDLLARRSGFSALAGRPLGWENLLAGGPSARLAREILLNGLLKSIGAMAASLGGVDALVFAGRLTDPSLAFIREVCARLAFLDVRVSTTPIPVGPVRTITAPGSAVTVLALEYDRLESLSQEALRIT